MRRLWVRVSAIKVTPSNAPVRSENGREYLLEEESQSELSVITLSSVGLLLHGFCAPNLLLNA